MGSVARRDGWRTAALVVLAVVPWPALSFAANAPAAVPLAAPRADPPAAGGAPRFDRDVRPILAENCFACHGPDAAQRQAGLRLDLAETALAPLDSGARAIVPGDPAASALLARVAAHDPDLRMPPAETRKQLSPAQVATLRAWIEAGAPWESHWSFVPPRRPPVPAATEDGRDGARGAIDAFVDAALHAQGLTPNGEAPPATWLRRASLDLTGLPPEPEALADFLADFGDAPPGAEPARQAAARERALARLFASPRYGEHLAVEWLDAARYADTHGYHYDNERTMWPWRDALVAAFNRNKPFDQFTIEQLAGDLLPDASPAQVIASGFQRNHPINWEGGIIPEEYLAEYVVDRVATTGTVWMGLTLGCARCHDHKFDPISQREFYQLYDIYHQVPEQGSDGLEGNAMPFVTVPDSESAARVAQLEERIAELQAWLEAPRPELDEAQARWVAEQAAREAGRWQPLVPVAASALHGAQLQRQPDGSLFATGPHAASEVYELSFVTRATGIVALRLLALADERLPDGGPGRASHANIVLSEFQARLAPLDDPAAAVPLRFVAAHADFSQKGFHVSAAIDGERTTGWALQGKPYGLDRTAVFVAEAPFGHAEGSLLTVSLRHESDYAQHALGRFALALSTVDDSALQPVATGPWSEIGPFVAASGPEAHAQVFGPEPLDGAPVRADLSASYAGAGPDGAELTWRPRPEWRDGHSHALEGERSASYLYRTLHAPDERTLTLALGSDDSLKVWLDGRLVRDNPVARSLAPDQDRLTLRLSPGAHELLLKVVDHGGESGFHLRHEHDHGLPVPLELHAALLASAAGGEGLSDEAAAALRAEFRAQRAPEWAARADALAAVQGQRAQVLAGVPTTMVMGSLDERRDTYVLQRGAYDRHGARVSAAAPALLPPLPPAADGGPPDRLALARWLVDPAHPLTARVIVNRLWRRCFGRGLVTTPDDFGVAGARPSHPELLDWLACEFVESGWDIQHMLRLFTLSATYRRSAQSTAEQRAADPDNLWLARATRSRLPAEVLRDQALFAAGLLVERLGGPPVYPYQPPGLWEEVGSESAAFTANAYRQSHGEDLWRRSLYGFRKRSVPPPAMALFDAPSRETCAVARLRTNTPLQALALLNDTTWLEAARVLAQRVLADVGAGTGEGAGGSDAALDAARLDRALGLLLARPARPEERARLLSLLEAQRAHFAADPSAAAALIGVGEAPLATSIRPAELASWMLVTSTLLNLDETATRG